MKKLIALILFIGLTSCNDGDFDIPSFEFSGTVKSCDEYLLYVANTDNTEVLILPLTTTQLGTTSGEENYNISSSLNVIYRIFDEGFDNDYFCQNIPPSTPTVLKELIAESGTINIITTEINTNGNITGYSYDITISELLFMDEKERIFFENFDFGSFSINN
jgi:hypothetical protein